MEKKIKEAIKGNWDDHFSKDFLLTRDEGELKSMNRLKKKGYLYFEKKVVEQLVATAEDSDIFWDTVENEN